MKQCRNVCELLLAIQWRHKMADVLSPAQRKLNMQRIRGKDTKPEMLIRRGLHAAGFRFRIHKKDLPGKPDLVFPKYKAVIFINGCFWHGHACDQFKVPTTRTEFWINKIDINRQRDKRNIEALTSLGWRVLVVWECSLRGRGRLPTATVLSKCSDFLTVAEEYYINITGSSLSASIE
jgi:DNA mismatch endonuclease (patch repair protein)